MCPAKLNSRLDTVDAFFRHIVNKHKNLCDDGKWSHLNSLIRACMSYRPNTCYWPPIPGNGPHLYPDQVNSLSVEEMQDPFRAARAARVAIFPVERHLVPNAERAMTMASLPLMTVRVGRNPS